MKTIGVLGGVGPQATMDFEARVHRISQQLIPPQGNSGYPPMVVLYFRQPPPLLGADGAALSPPQVNPALLDAAAKLGPLADFLVITANGPHIFQPQIEQAAGRPVLSMIALTLDEARRRGWRKVGVLGLGVPRVYLGPLDGIGLPYETIDDALRARLDKHIIALMEGRVGVAGQAVAQEAVDALRARGVDGVILGCTEIPLLLGDAADAPDLLNPGALLAEAAVRHAMDA